MSNAVFTPLDKYEIAQQIDLHQLQELIGPLADKLADQEARIEIEEYLSLNQSPSPLLVRTATMIVGPRTQRGDSRLATVWFLPVECRRRGETSESRRAAYRARRDALPSRQDVAKHHANAKAAATVDETAAKKEMLTERLASTFEEVVIASKQKGDSCTSPIACTCSAASEPHWHYGWWPCDFAPSVGAALAVPALAWREGELSSLANAIRG